MKHVLTRVYSEVAPYHFAVIEVEEDRFRAWYDAVFALDGGARGVILRIELHMLRIFLGDGDQVCFGEACFTFYSSGGFHDLLRSLSVLR